MSPLLDCFMICLNEEEMIQYALESFESIVSVVGIVSIVDNGSTDATLEIIHSWKDRLPIVLTKWDKNRHHGNMRTAALAPCTAPWIFYLDSDESFTNNMLAWLQSGQLEECDQWEFYKYSTIKDREHYTDPGNGPSRRLFRYREGVGFPQEIHTEPRGPGLDHLCGRNHIEGPWLFDHTGCKSPEALAAKGWRYQWAAHVEGIGPWHEYTGRVGSAYERGDINLFSDAILGKIFTGPK